MALVTKLKENPKRANMFSSVVVEDGKIEWSSKDGKKREQIIETIGMEYKQINILASIIIEIVNADSSLLNNPIITDGISKFVEVNSIRHS